MVVVVTSNPHEGFQGELIGVNLGVVLSESRNSLCVDAVMRVGVIAGQSNPCRRLAAAANGPMTKLNSDSAHRIENGAPKDKGSMIAACEAATPKISTGTVSYTHLTLPTIYSV